MTFSHQFRVRYSECDQQGVVFNGHYLFYYDQALVELFRALEHPLTGPRDWDIVVAESTLRYRDSVTFDELIQLSMPIAHLGNTSMSIEPRFEVGETLKVEGSVRHVFIDPETFRPKPIPESIRSGLEQL